MMTNCKDCTHRDVCRYNDGVNKWCKGDCPHFKDCNQVVEFPCKVGDTVYYIGGLQNALIKPAVVERVIIHRDRIEELGVTNNGTYFENDFNIFFLTREEAEKHLKERENNEKS